MVDKAEWFMCASILLCFGMIFGALIHTSYYEHQLDKELNEIVGEDYMKIFNFQEHRNLNQLYDKDGNCMGIYWIEITWFNYEIREVKNFAQCEAL